MRRLLEVVAGIVLVRVLGRPAREPARGPRRARPAAVPPPAGVRPAARPASGAAAARGRPRGPLVSLTLGALAVGALLMLLFEVWYTRLVGVLALFTFVVAGVFLITGSGLLDPEEDG